MSSSSSMDILNELGLASIRGGLPSIADSDNDQDNNNSDNHHHSTDIELQDYSAEMLQREFNLFNRNPAILTNRIDLKQHPDVQSMFKHYFITQTIADTDSTNTSSNNPLTNNRIVLFTEKQIESRRLTHKEYLHLHQSISKTLFSFFDHTEAAETAEIDWKRTKHHSSTADSLNLTEFGDALFELAESSTLSTAHYIKFLQVIYHRITKPVKVIQSTAAAAGTGAKKPSTSTPASSNKKQSIDLSGSSGLGTGSIKGLNSGKLAKSPIAGGKRNSVAKVAMLAAAAVKQQSLNTSNSNNSHTDHKLPIRAYKPISEITAIPTDLLEELSSELHGEVEEQKNVFNPAASIATVEAHRRASAIVTSTSTEKKPLLFRLASSVVESLRNEKNTISSPKNGTNQSESPIITNSNGDSPITPIRAVAAAAEKQSTPTSSTANNNTTATATPIATFGSTSLSVNVAASPATTPPQTPGATVSSLISSNSNINTPTASASGMASPAAMASPKPFAPRQLVRSNSGSVQCDMCEEYPAVVFCRSCDQYLCSENQCDAEIHRNAKRKGHSRVPVIKGQLISQYTGPGSNSASGSAAATPRASTPVNLTNTIVSPPSAVSGLITSSTIAAFNTHTIIDNTNSVIEPAPAIDIDSPAIESASVVIIPPSPIAAAVLQPTPPPMKRPGSITIIQLSKTAKMRAATLAAGDTNNTIATSPSSAAPAIITTDPSALATFQSRRSSAPSFTGQSIPESTVNSENAEQSTNTTAAAVVDPVPITDSVSPMITVVRPKSRSRALTITPTSNNPANNAIPIPIAWSTAATTATSTAAAPILSPHPPTSPAPPSASVSASISVPSSPQPSTDNTAISNGISPHQPAVPSPSPSPVPAVTKRSSIVIIGRQSSGSVSSTAAAANVSPPSTAPIVSVPTVTPTPPTSGRTSNNLSITLPTATYSPGSSSNELQQPHSAGLGPETGSFRANRKSSLITMGDSAIGQSMPLTPDAADLISLRMRRMRAMSEAHNDIHQSSQQSQHHHSTASSDLLQNALGLGSNRKISLPSLNENRNTSNNINNPMFPELSRTISPLVTQTANSSGTQSPLITELNPNEAADRRRASLLALSQLNDSVHTKIAHSGRDNDF